MERSQADARLSARAQKMADRTIACQSRLAGWLNAGAGRLGQLRTRLLLGALGLGFGLYCLRLVLSALL